LLATGTSDEEAKKSMTDIGVSDKEAESIIADAKSSQTISEETTEKESVPKDSGKKEKFEAPSMLSSDDFWNSNEGSFFTGSKKSVQGTKGFSLLTKRRSKVDPNLDTISDSAEPMHFQPSHYKFKKVKFRETVPVLVSDFDKLIDRGGFKKGDTILFSGGAGTGKTTFGMQFLYNGARELKQKCVYLTLEETAEKIKENMMENFGWDLDELEKQGLLAIIKIDPLTIARAVEATLTKERGGLYIEFEKFDLPFQFDLPFKPDRVVVDSLSALSIAFVDNHQGYRQYLRHLFQTLEDYGSVNLVFGETEQQPNVYSRMGIEEFLADAVVVFYNIKVHNTRETALEILKLRSSAHSKKLIPYQITSRGFEIYINQEIFRED